MKDLFNDNFAKRLAFMQGSAIRDLLKYAGKPGFISLGGGYPDPISFPSVLFDKLYLKVKKKYGISIYQYSKTEGFDPLLNELTLFLKRKNRAIIANPENILVTVGSQQALTILGMMFINEGDYIAVEAPTYLGALQAFNPFNPRYLPIATDEEGIIPGELEIILKSKIKIKFIYSVPTFQNPSGRTIPFGRRKMIADLLVRYNVLLIEDDPYSELRYEGVPLTSLFSLAPQNVIHLFTFSKTFAPDFRMGGLVGTKLIKETAVLIKQGLDLCSSTFNQAMLMEYLSGGYLEPHIVEIIHLYKPRRDLMINLIEQHFPPYFKHSRPEGGMFIWVYDDKNICKKSIKDVLQKTLKQNVSFVPGDPFFAGVTDVPFSMRLNFTNQTEENIEKGIKIIGEILSK